MTFSPRDLSQGQALTAKPCPWDPLKDSTTDWGQVITNMKLFGIFQIEGFFGAGGDRTTTLLPRVVGTVMRGIYLYTMSMVSQFSTTHPV